MTRFLLRNAVALASLVVAGSSLFVAGLSLHYTIAAQTRDAFYKELSIRPSIQIASDSEHYAILLQNVGLGPAVLGRAVFSNGTHCLDTDTVHDWDQAHKFFDNFSNAVQNYMLVGMPAVTERTVTRVPMPGISTPSTGVTIKAGESLRLIYFDPKEMEEYFALLVKYTKDDAAPTNVLHELMSRGISIPLRFHYCSLSGNFCNFAGPDDIVDCSKTPQPAKPDSTPGSQIRGKR